MEMARKGGGVRTGTVLSPIIRSSRKISSSLDAGFIVHTFGLLVPLPFPEGLLSTSSSPSLSLSAPLGREANKSRFMPMKALAAGVTPVLAVTRERLMRDGGG